MKMHGIQMPFPMTRHLVIPLSLTGYDEFNAERAAGAF